MSHKKIQRIMDNRPTLNMTTHNVSSPCELQLAVWQRPLAQIARDCGIPLRQLMTRIRAEDIGLPPPGYWEMLERGLSRAQALKQIGWTPPMIRKVSGMLRNAREQKQKMQRKTNQ